MQSIRVCAMEAEWEYYRVLFSRYSGARKQKNKALLTGYHITYSRSQLQQSQTEANSLKFTCTKP